MATYTIQFKRGKSSSWTLLNPILNPGEPGFEIDTGKVKIGNGINTWSELLYLNDNKTIIVNASTYNDFPVIGEVNVLYKASQEKQLYQWNNDTQEYELLFNNYITQEQLQEAIDNIVLPEIALEDYATKAYTQELFEKMVPLTDQEILEICN